MKAFVFFVMLLSNVFPFAYAATFPMRYNSDFWSLHIKINNIGSDTCNLQETPKYTGELLGAFPNTLPATGETKAFTISGRYSIPKGTIFAKLIYQCGAYKKFTLEMSQRYDPKHGRRYVRAAMIDAVDVFEKHDLIEGDVMMGGVHNEVIWVLMH